MGETRGDKKRADQSPLPTGSKASLVQVGFARAASQVSQWSRDQRTENGAEDLRD